MFKILIHALWSKDYMTPLMKVLMEVFSLNTEQAYRKIREIEKGNRVHFQVDTLKQAEFLATELLQFGCYIEVTQVGPLTDEAFIEDIRDFFDEDMSALRVVYDKQGHVAKIMEEQGHSYIGIERQAVRDFVGEEMIRLGASRLEDEDWPELKARLEKAIAENEQRRMEIRAERARMKQQRMANQPKNSRLEEE
jgi:hypothetical protein